jgi:hypothetical protein
MLLTTLFEREPTMRLVVFGDCEIGLTDRFQPNAFENIRGRFSKRVCSKDYQAWSALSLVYNGYR